jgi:amino-acid N-acetyltransferase
MAADHDHRDQGNTTTMDTPEIRRAGLPDAAAVRDLLTAAGLPTAGLTPGLEHFLVATRNGTIVGAVGLELYPPIALLRSAVVHPDERGRGTGAALIQSIEDLAQFAGIQRIILLTTTAGKYFAGRGYRTIERAGVVGPVTASAEFTGACPASAECMEKTLL